MGDSTSREASFYLEQNMTSPEFHTLASGAVVVYSSRSPEKETPNEDALAVIPIDDKSGVIVVADGVGGASGGGQASKIALETINHCLNKAIAEGESIRSGILNGFEIANQKIRNSLAE